MSKEQIVSRPHRCPSREELVEFTAGHLPVLAADAVVEHVSRCASCRQALVALDGQSDELIEQLRVAFRDPPLGKEECQRIAAHVETIQEQSQRVADSLHQIDGDDHVGRPTDSDSRPHDGDADGQLHVRCPFCHEVVRLSGSKLDEPITCHQCRGRFGLAIDQLEQDGANVRGRIAHFELEERLGEGSFGSVWKAIDTHLNRPVALKVPRKGRLESKEIASFLREARTASLVRHANIVAVHEVGLEHDTVYIASAWIDGESLSQLLSRERVSIVEATEITLSVADALHAAHLVGIVHRDLKPANILLNRERIPHIADFGLAKHSVRDVAVTVEGNILGTVAYMSPEQARGKGASSDERSDIYSLGCILYELLTGKAPFDGDLQMLIAQILFDDPIPPRKMNGLVSRDLETICLKCLEKQPGKRYRSADLMADDLRSFLDGDPIRARPVGRAGKVWRWCRRKPGMAAISAVALLLLAATVTVLAAAHTKTTSSLRMAEENLYFYRIAAAQRKWAENDQRVAEATLDECPDQMRDFEWGYLKHLVNTPTRKLRNAGGAVAYCPVEKELATGGGLDVYTKIWNTESGSRIHRMMGHTRHITALRYSLDGTLLLSAGGLDRTVRTWDAIEGDRLRTFGYHEKKVVKCAFSPDESSVVSYGLDNTVRVWDAATGDQQHVMQISARRVRDVAFSPTERHVAIASGREEKSQIAIYAYDRDEVLFQIPTFETAVGGLAFSPDGRRLAAGEIHGHLRVWQLNPLKLLTTMAEPVSEKTRLAFDSEGQRIAAVAWDNTIRIWDAEIGQELRTLRGHLPPVYSLAFSADGRQLAAGAGGSEVCIWDVTTQQGSVTYTGGTSVVIDVATSPSGELLAAGFADGTVRVWDRATRQLKLRFSGTGMSVRSVSFSPDGTRFAIAGDDQVVQVRDVASGELKLKFTQHTRPLRSAVFSPDGSRIASAGLDRVVRVWDAATGEVQLTRSFKGPSIRSLEFDPVGERLAAGGSNGQVIVWNARSGAQLWDNTRTTGRVWDLAFSPDGSLLAVSRGTGIVWLCSAADGTPLRSLGDLAVGLPSALAFSSNGKRLITASAHTAVSLWEVPTGRAVLSLARYPSIAGAVAFFPDGQGVVTGDTDGTVKVWAANRY